MAELTRIVALLQEQRRALLDQLAAVDRAIAALDGSETDTDDAVALKDAALEDVALEAVALEDVAVDDGSLDETPDAAVRARHVKARRTQTDSHKHAIAVGKRKARHARDAAKGLAREIHDDSFVPAIRLRGQGEAPRLVKRPVKKG